MRWFFVAAFLSIASAGVSSPQGNASADVKYADAKYAMVKIDKRDREAIAAVRDAEIMGSGGGMLNVLVPVREIGKLSEGARGRMVVVHRDLASFYATRLQRSMCRRMMTASACAAEGCAWSAEKEACSSSLLPREREPRRPASGDAGDAAGDRAARPLAAEVAGQPGDLDNGVLSAGTADVPRHAPGLPMLRDGPSNYSGYYRFQDVMDELDHLNELYPTIISPKWSLGKTFENRDIWCVNVTANAGADQDLPATLFTGGTHAREPIGWMNILHFLHHLGQSFGTDKEVTSLLFSRRLFFVPVLNPDGVVHNEKANPRGGGMHRKNMRDDDVSPCSIRYPEATPNETDESNAYGSNADDEDEDVSVSGSGSGSGSGSRSRSDEDDDDDKYGHVAAARADSGDHQGETLRRHQEQGTLRVDARGVNVAPSTPAEAQPDPASSSSHLGDPAGPGSSLGDVSSVSRAGANGDRRKIRQMRGSPGVDLNRNWPYRWGQDDAGSTPDKCDETYRGVSQGSEAEVQAIIKLMTRTKPNSAMNFHAYGNALLKPGAYMNNADFPRSIPVADYETFLEYTKALTAVDDFIIDGEDSLHYAVNGASDDWMYKVAGAFTFTTEVGTDDDGFWPVPDRIWSLCRGQVAPMTFLARAGGSFLVPSTELYPDPTPRGNSFRVVLEIRNRGLGSTKTVYVKAAVPWDIAAPDARMEFNVGPISKRNRTYVEIGPLGPLRATTDQCRKINITVVDGAYLYTSSISVVIGEETYAKECNDNTPMMASDEETTTPEDTEFKHHVHHIHSGMDSDDILGEGKSLLKQSAPVAAAAGVEPAVTSPAGPAREPEEAAAPHAPRAPHAPHSPHAPGEREKARSHRSHAVPKIKHHRPE